MPAAPVLVASRTDGAPGLRKYPTATARILDLANLIGSIEQGKDGDLALYDGDPFEYTTHAVGTIIGGNRVSGIAR